MGKIREEVNAEGIGEIENIVANMDEGEQEMFNLQVERNRKDRKWCEEHGVNYRNPNMGVIVRDTYEEIYVVGEDQSR